MVTVALMKQSLRISNNSLDDEVSSLLNAAKLDCQRVGIDVATDDDLLDTLIKLYVKWQWNYDEKGEQYGRQYAALRDALSMSAKYKAGE